MVAVVTHLLDGGRKLHFVVGVIQHSPKLMHIIKDAAYAGCCQYLRLNKLHNI